MNRPAMEFCMKKKVGKQKSYPPTGFFSFLYLRKLTSNLFFFCDLSAGSAERRWQWQPNLTRRQSGKDINVTVFRTNVTFKDARRLNKQQITVRRVFYICIFFLLLFEYLVVAAAVFVLHLIPYLGSTKC